MGRQLQSKESFPFLVDRIPRPPPFTRCSCRGIPVEIFFEVFAERGGRAAAESTHRWALCSFDKDTASLAPSLPPRWLVAVPQVSSKPKKTLGNVGRVPSAPGGPYGNLTEGASESPPQHLPKHLPRLGVGGRGRVGSWKKRSFPAGLGTHLVLPEQRAHSGARPHTRSCQQVGAQALPGPPRPPARPHPAARWPPPSLAQAHAAPGSPWRCHGGGEQLQWALGQPCDPRRGELCQ